MTPADYKESRTMKYVPIAWACPVAACLLALPPARAGDLKMTR